MLPCTKAISHGKHIQRVSFLSLKLYVFHLPSLQISTKLTRNATQMSRDYDIGDHDDDYPTAVAAAAYAVWSSLEESKARDQNAKVYGGPRVPPNKTRRKSQKKAEIPPQQPRKTALTLVKTSKQSLKDPDDIEIPDTDDTSSNYPSLGRPSTFPDKHTNVDDRESPEIPHPIPYDRHTPQQFVTKAGPRDSMADAWEKEEMASIKERYERLKGTIDKWEIKKKKKANLKLETMEGNRRDHFSRSHHNEVQRIEEIAGEARAQAERKRIKEEFKVKDKANKIRSTGKLPATCLCF